MSKTPTLCLNMIVKNESRIIRRLLDSVSKLIDSYCICDTGSTDDTKSIIENYFRERNIPGKVIQEPFQNFEYNRSFALKACDDIDADYVLLLDADMVLWYNDKIAPEKLKMLLTTHDCFFMFQGSERMYYKNTRIVKNKAGFSYKGVTHEYVELPHNATQSILVKDMIFINDIGDGGAKADKFSRDVRLLKGGLEKDPNNERYMFYLANSLKDLAGTQAHTLSSYVDQIKKVCENIKNEFKDESSIPGPIKSVEVAMKTIMKEKNDMYLKYINESIECYKKRIAMGGFWEEVWYSYYNIGNCYMYINEVEKAIYHFQQSHVLYPERVENLYEVVKYYREKGQNDLAVHNYLLGKASMEKFKGRDYLFIQKDIYDYKLDYEMTILGYYKNPINMDMCKLCMGVLDQHISIDEGIGRNVLSNYKFYSERLRDKDSGIWKEGKWGELLTTLGNTSLEIPSTKFPDFVSSTPTFCMNQKNPSECFGMIRYVDYKVDEHGGYVQKDLIQTKNVVAHMKLNAKSEWTVERETFLDYDSSHDNLYVGLEDVRIHFHTDGNVYYTANRGKGYGNMVIEHGIINQSSLKTEQSRFLKIENQSAVEKNWVMFSYNKDPEPIYMVYNWHPMVIGKVVGDQFVKTKTNNTSYIFKFFRGSTNGVLVNNELWFLCHVVSYEGRRHYYHVMVMLDKDTLDVKRISKMFTFEGQKVEYCLGMDLYKENMRFGISIMDRETKYMSIPTSWFLS